MSIYCSMEGIGDEWDAKRKEKPLRYGGSHLFPKASDPRGGRVDLAFIARHITRDGKDDRPENSPMHPWLRFGVSSEDNESGDTILLTREQVQKLRDQLDWFLKESA